MVFGTLLLALYFGTVASLDHYVDYYMEDQCSESGTPTQYQATTLVQSIAFGTTSTTFQPHLRERGCRSGYSFSSLNDTFGFLVTPVSLSVPGTPGNCSEFVRFEGLEDEELNQQRFCGQAFPNGSRAVRTSGDTFTIWWFSPPVPGVERTANFRVVMVAYVNRSSEAECPESWRRCNTGACIESRVWCDGIDNCGDGSDESATTCAPAAYRLTIPAIVIIVMLVAFVLISVMVVCYVRRRRSAYRAG